MNEINNLPMNIKVILVGSNLNRLITSAIFPFIALYLSDMFSNSFASIFLSFSIILSFFINIYSGYIIDKLPRKKLLILSSFSEFIIFVFLTIFLFLSYNVLFCVFYILLMASGSFRRPSLEVLMQDSVTNESRKLTYRLNYWLTNLTMSVGFLIGGALYSNHKSTLFLLATICSLILTCTYLFFVRDIKVSIKKTNKINPFFELLNSYLEVCKDKKFVYVTIGMMFIFSAEIIMSSFVAIRLNNEFNPINIFSYRLNGVTLFSILQFTNAIVVVLLTLILGKYLEKYNEKLVFLAGIFLYSIGYAINIFSNIWWVLLLFIIIATIGEIIYAPSYNAQILNLIPSNKRGAYNAFRSLSITGAELIGRLSILIGIILPSQIMGIILFILLSISGFIISKYLFQNTVSNTH
ncbi:MFS transporter [Staphylococcus ursi]|uniref:MFS transporter n=1 Tax=Staphylococcus sp. MI 10-1553 TaxID=1912064 RepID=UPI001398B61F|nr:MFS transporter [Staphylococcus sp. MI 10-1553]QHW35909.1 MFS transporter [Staphylococcus sp. MI 10-1553]